MNKFIVSTLLLASVLQWSVSGQPTQVLPPVYDCSDNNHHGAGYYVDVQGGCEYYHHCEVGQGAAVGIKCYHDLKVDLGMNAGGNVDECWPMCVYPEDVECPPEYDGARLAVEGGQCKLVSKP